MIYTGDLIKIDGNVIPSIVTFKVGRNKLWKNADRNMEGEVRATLVGIFPKIELNIGVTSQDQISDLIDLLDQAYFSVEWFDVKTGATHTADYYASDYTYELLSKPRGLYKPFTVNLVPVRKR